MRNFVAAGSWLLAGDPAPFHGIRLLFGLEYRLIAPGCQEETFKTERLFLPLDIGCPTDCSDIEEHT
jgi:hypothetical protein